MKTTMNTIYPAFALFALACFVLSPQVCAVCQEGCDLNTSSTFLGDDALLKILPILEEIPKLRSANSAEER